MYSDLTIDRQSDIEKSKIPYKIESGLYFNIFNKETNAGCQCQMYSCLRRGGFLVPYWLFSGARYTRAGAVCVNEPAQPDANSCL